MSTKGTNYGSPSNGQIETATVYIINHVAAERDSLVAQLQGQGHKATGFESVALFLHEADSDVHGCIVLDASAAGAAGLEQYDRLAQSCQMPVIIMAAHASVSMSAQAFRKGAIDFLEKPCAPAQLVEAIRRAISASAQRRTARAGQLQAKEKLSHLSDGERAVMRGIMEGKINKVIAAELDVSLRTIEYRKASLRKKLGAHTNAELISLIHWLRSQSEDSAF
jgi:FixJ family two-component response regulator